MALARQNKREDQLVEGIDLDEIDLAVAAAQQQGLGITDKDKGKGDTPENKSKDDKNPKVKRSLIAVGVVLASLIMALSILLPSLSAIVDGISSSTEAATEEAATEEATTEEAETEDASEEDNSTQSYIDTIDERYGTTADTLKTKVEADESDKASLINLANTYYEWATYVANFASTDAQNEHVEKLFQNALTYYDKYLALDDAKAARVSRAVCQFNLDSVNEAITSLEDLVAQEPDYAPAWANLGMMYNACDETDLALEAYNKVLVVDPNDTYGLKSNAESQISALSASTQESAETSAETE